MLLECGELVTDPCNYQLHDYQQYARLELASIGFPSAQSTWFACVRLGNVSNAVDQIEMRTVGFALPMIGQFEESYAFYRQIQDRHICEYSYPEFLLRWLRHQSKVRVVFSVENGHIRRFAVQLDNLEVQGRVPSDIDVLGTFFGSVLVTSD